MNATRQALAAVFTVFPHENREDPTTRRRHRDEHKPESGNIIDKLERYAAAARRAYRAHRELQNARKAGIQNEAKQFEIAMRASVARASACRVPDLGDAWVPDARPELQNEPISALRESLRAVLLAEAPAPRSLT